MMFTTNIFGVIHDELGESLSDCDKDEEDGSKEWYSKNDDEDENEDGLFVLNKVAPNVLFGQVRNINKVAANVLLIYLFNFSSMQKLNFTFYVLKLQMMFK